MHSFCECGGNALFSRKVVGLGEKSRNLKKRKKHAARFSSPKTESVQKLLIFICYRVDYKITAIIIKAQQELIKRQKIMNSNSLGCNVPNKTCNKVYKFQKKAKRPVTESVSIIEVS
jgi:hypothetical protein